jgi:hypothetical protein
VGAMAEQYAAINRSLDEAEKGLVEVGLYDAQTARALFMGIRPPTGDNVVGNLADVQRQPFMPPGFEQGAMEGANPTPTVQPGAPVEVLGRTSAEKLADYGVTIPESPATSAEAIERASTTTNAPTQIDDSNGQASGTAESPQDQASPEALEGMTKEQLQTYADQRGISGVSQSSQTKDEMLAAIREA